MLIPMLTDEAVWEDFINLLVAEQNYTKNLELCSVQQ